MSDTETFGPFDIRIVADPCPDCGGTECVCVCNLGVVELNAVRSFVRRVNRRAEANIEKTGRLEGSHYAAMQVELIALGENSQGILGDLHT